MQAAAIVPSAFPALALTSLAIDIAPGSIRASATGNVSGVMVSAELSSIVQPGTSGNQRLGSIKVTARSGLDMLLFSQASLISSDLGFSVPTPAASSTSAGTSDVTAEMVFESSRGLRMLSLGVSSASGSLGVAELARRVGFSWQTGGDSSDMVLLRSAQLVYVPKRAGAPALVWNGQTMNPDLSIQATLDVPGMSLSGVRGALLVQAGSKLTVQVSAAWGLAACLMHGSKQSSICRDAQLHETTCSKCQARSVLLCQQCH
jgi:hypothetical protein